MGSLKLIFFAKNLKLRTNSLNSLAEALQLAVLFKYWCVFFCLCYQVFKHQPWWCLDEVSPGQHQLLLCPHPVCPHIGYGLQLQVLKTCRLPVVTSWKLQHLQGLLGNPWHLSTGSCWTVSCCPNIWVGKVSRRRWNKQRTSSKHYRKPTTQIARGVPQDQGTANSSRVQVFWCNMQAAATRKTDINLRRSNTGHLQWCWSGTSSESRSNTASTPSSNWWTFPLCFVKRQTDRRYISCAALAYPRHIPAIIIVLQVQSSQCTSWRSSSSQSQRKPWKETNTYWLEAGK